MTPVVVEGEVVEQLPSALYRVRRRGAGRFVTGPLVGDPRRNFIRILPGDRVRVRLSPHDVGARRDRRAGSSERERSCKGYVRNYRFVASWEVRAGAWPALQAQVGRR